MRSATGLDELKGLDGRRVVLVFTDGDDRAAAPGSARWSIARAPKK